MYQQLFIQVSAVALSDVSGIEVDASGRQATSGHTSGQPLVRPPRARPCSGHRGQLHIPGHKLFLFKNLR